MADHEGRAGAAVRAEPAVRVAPLLETRDDARPGLGAPTAQTDVTGPMVGPDDWDCDRR